VLGKLSLEVGENETMKHLFLPLFTENLCKLFSYQNSLKIETIDSPAFLTTVAPLEHVRLFLKCVLLASSGRIIKLMPLLLM